MKKLFKYCDQCSIKPGTVFCQNCQARFCYDCDGEVHNQNLNHKTEICSLTQMRQINQYSQIQTIDSQIFSQTKQNHVVIAQQGIQLQKEELTKIELEIKQFEQVLNLQENKWKKQFEILEKEYSEKIAKFEQKVQKSESTITEIKQQSKQEDQINEMMKQLKEQLEGQKNQLLQKVDQQKEQLNDKEQLLQNLIKQEKDLSAEINKKEILIGKFKEFIQQQQKEKELILNENERIKKQLTEIKQLFKEKLPQLGLDENFFNFDEEVSDAQEEEQEPQIQQNVEDSTEEDEGIQ
ncbi:unnamed protein product [Paramecium primaurelia]|uniref:B box-type domain-containing protein n=1 Tax=Paramecium primaurelia TaxID=5886 RepID=A0A8S1LL31_PARPR|nr:unnamed protein product [Paramecium primaurelia]